MGLNFLFNFKRLKCKISIIPDPSCTRGFGRVQRMVRMNGRHYDAGAVANNVDDRHGNANDDDDDDDDTIDGC